MKGCIKQITKKTWDSPDGKKVPYYSIFFEDDAREFGFWNDDLSQKMVGDELEFTESEKNGRWRGKLPTTSRGGSGGRGKTPEEMEFEKLKLKQAARTMCLSYSKDIIVAMLNKELISAGKIDDGLKHYAETMLGWVEK